MSEHLDDDLRSAFGALKRQSDAPVPSFESMTSVNAVSRWRHRQRRRRTVLLAAAIIIPTVIVLRSRPESGLDLERFTALTGLDPGKVSWEAPSDFLLDVPGRELLRTVPSIQVQVPAAPVDSTRPPDSNRTSLRSEDS